MPADHSHVKLRTISSQKIIIITIIIIIIIIIIITAWDFFLTNRTA